jgi:hypothetical protein
MRYALLFLTLFATQLNGQEIRYTQKDSTKICHMLAQLEKSGSTKTSQLLVDAGTLLLGTPYVAGTLDREKDESLTINISEVDCSTFVDQALALALTVGEGKCDFSAFCKNLEKVRYRNGICNGYESRLHYFSWWVADGEKRGIVRELSGKAFKESQKLDLGFMSRNPDKYMQLNSDSILTAKIAEYEKPFRNITCPYIPKHLLAHSAKRLPIRNGDIIAIVTTIKGLDVTHQGIAVWQDGKLHMLHASSKEKKVILDRISLHDYLAPRKSAPGIRAVRVM